jgi:hypothetical protein
MASTHDMAAPSDSTSTRGTDTGFLVVPLLLSLNDTSSSNETAGAPVCSAAAGGVTSAAAAAKLAPDPSAAQTNRGRFERWADRLRADVERTSRRWRRRHD